MSAVTTLFYICLFPHNQSNHGENDRESYESIFKLILLRFSKSIKIKVFWDVTTQSLVARFQRFWRKKIYSKKSKIFFEKKNTSSNGPVMVSPGIRKETGPAVRAHVCSMWPVPLPVKSQVSGVGNKHVVSDNGECVKCVISHAQRS
jgi:hypothetical protein